MVEAVEIAKMYHQDRHRALPCIPRSFHPKEIRSQIYDATRNSALDRKPKPQTNVEPIHIDPRRAMHNPTWQPANHHTGDSNAISDKKKSTEKRPRNQTRRGTTTSTKNSKRTVDA
jgi:hypothetical protein